MAIKKYELDLLSLPPRVPNQVSAAKEQLRVAHTTLQGLFDSLHVVRLAASVEDKRDRGPLREGEVDLLRSAIVLAAAGMEAVIKRLVSDALPTILSDPHRHPEATKRFKEYMAAQLKRNNPPNALFAAILADDPRPQMGAVYIEGLVSSSIQKETELRNLRDALGIADTVITDQQITDLRGFLTARNQVVHDLDLRKPGAPESGKRYRRTALTVVGQCNDAIALTTSYLTGTADLLRKRRSRP